MKRKALVAAIAGILSAPAIAAIDDAGMKYTSASEGFYGSIRVPLVVEDDKDADLNEGGQSSRLGLQGTVDLGGGLTSNYRYEWDIQAGDDFATNRLRYLGLTGDFGTVTFGDQWNVDYDYVFVGTDVTQNDTGNLAEEFRWDSSARYDSNDLNGFKFSGQVQMDGSGDDDAEDVDRFGIGASYSTAGFTLAAVYLTDREVSNNYNGDATAAYVASLSGNGDDTIAGGGITLADGSGSGTDTRRAASISFINGPETTGTGAQATDNDVQYEDNENTAGTVITAAGSGLDADTDNTIGLLASYGQDNWKVTYFYKGSDTLGSKASCASQVNNVACSAAGNSDRTNDVYTVTLDPSGGDLTAHSLAGQVSFDKLTFRGVYEVQEEDMGAIGAYDTSIFVGEVQYDLGSKSVVWLAFKNTDQDLADDEVTKFTLGYRVDF